MPHRCTEWQYRCTAKCNLILQAYTAVGRIIKVYNMVTQDVQYVQLDVAQILQVYG
jgi:hypothetical protein